ncbi:sensor histidine kinase [Flexithrix dorotheae]|uniref:sensor histidine kinase n=1 Tax=Flexithrix dorotheae TaxID=70993 RepID=UPI00038204B5|nr:ATP-binding protein [Flexithrix dorotheae]
MIELWRKIANLGIDEKMPPSEAKAIGLVNRLSFIAVWVFIFSSLLDFITGQFNMLVLELFNICIFLLILFLNYKKYFFFSKHFLMWFGLAVITFINIAFDYSAFPQANYIILIVLPILIFNSNKLIYFYYTLALASFIFTFFYQTFNPPLFEFDEMVVKSSSFLSVILVFFIICFSTIKLFKNLNRKFEQVLISQNNLLTSQKEEIYGQAEDLNKKNKVLNELNEELSKALEKLKNMQNQLVNAEKMASLGQLTAGIAHEINNPINFVSGNISPLVRDFKDIKALFIEMQNFSQKLETHQKMEFDKIIQSADLTFVEEEIEALINGIEEGANRTKEIVAGLRNFSRIDEVKKKKVNIHEGINSTLTLLNNKIKNRITIHKDFGELPLVSCFPSKLNQVFMNLLNNAIQAITDNGDIYITTQLDDERVLISIRDTGLGISSKLQSKIFDPFFTTKEIGKGTGLGLSISYGIIKDHGGEIKVFSELGKGAEFLISLPIEQEN